MNAFTSVINSSSSAVCSVVDINGNVVSSTQKAYLCNVIIQDKLVLNQVNTDLSSWYWEKVVCPSQDDPFPEVPFPITRDFNTSSNYEGISYINLNNAVYITDGGFPMKYDGYQVYRMGMPRVLASGASIFNGGSSTTNGSGFQSTGVTYTSAILFPDIFYGVTIIFNCF